MIDPVVSNAPSNHRLRRVLLVLVVLGIGTLAVLLWLRRPLPPHQVTTAPNTIRVLFIGNSYTSVNNLPGLVIALAAGEARPLDAEMIVVGGATLRDHWTDGKALAAIQRAQWDYVVLQEQSLLASGPGTSSSLPFGDPAIFGQYVRLFDQAIRKTGGKTVLYMTWARQNAPDTQAFLTKAYQDIGAELGIIVAPVGAAWQQSLRTSPTLILHQDDGSHPNGAGSYLAACVFYATFYGKSPVGLPAHIANSLVDSSGTLETGDVTLDPVNAQFLQRIAWYVVSQQRATSGK